MPETTHGVAVLNHQGSGTGGPLTGEKSARAHSGVPQTAVASFQSLHHFLAGIAPLPEGENILFNDKFATEADYLNLTSLCLQFVHIIL